jgi:hypothetical protein
MEVQAGNAFGGLDALPDYLGIYLLDTQKSPIHETVRPICGLQQK